MFKILLNYLEPTYHLGPITLHLFGTFLALGILIGLLPAKRLSLEKGINSDYFYGTVIASIIGGIVGARLLSVALNPASYLDNPLSVFALNQGGLAYFGGLAGGALAAFIYTRKYRINLWIMADIIAPALALGEAIGRLGCDVYGYASTQAPFPRIVNGIAYHNIPLYNSLATLGIFVVLWYLRDKVSRGQLFLLYLLMYGVSRTFIDYFRGDQVFISLFNSAQLGSLGIAVLALVLFYSRFNPTQIWRKNQ
ncbi:MAG: prolipoprotein diacylglyceryl transferase [Bacillota bacterium]|nr:prolipoprotein diacylglyceryl transferase [Bacillota bacterium]